MQLSTPGCPARGFARPIGHNSHASAWRVLIFLPYLPRLHGLHSKGATPYSPNLHEIPQMTPYLDSDRFVSAHLPLGCGQIVRSVGESHVRMGPTTRGRPSISGVKNVESRIRVVAGPNEYIYAPYYSSLKASFAVLLSMHHQCDVCHVEYRSSHSHFWLLPLHFVKRALCYCLNGRALTRDGDCASHAMATFSSTRCLI